MNIDSFERLPLMGILRGGDADIIEPLVETVAAAGLETLEVAMNTAGAVAMIRRAGEVAAGRITIGAGTVLDLETLASALEAGASFIVMPTLVHDVVARCRELAVPVFPGALTPREIHDAWRAGATMVKVFPVKVFGAEYLREVKGPFAEVKLLACGGVSADNMTAFFECGASAVAFGASVFKPEWLVSGELSRIGQGVADMVAAVGRLGPCLAR